MLRRNLSQVANKALLAICFRLLSYVAYSAILKIEARCSSETYVDFWPTTRLWVGWNVGTSDHDLCLLQRDDNHQKCHWSWSVTGPIYMHSVPEHETTGLPVRRGSVRCIYPNFRLMTIRLLSDAVSSTEEIDKDHWNVLQGAGTSGTEVWRMSFTPSWWVWLIKQEGRID